MGNLFLRNIGEKGSGTIGNKMTGGNAQTVRIYGLYSSYYVIDGETYLHEVNRFKYLPLKKKKSLLTLNKE